LPFICDSLVSLMLNIMREYLCTHGKKMINKLRNLDIGNP
jgi:hypothetical protein